MNAINNQPTVINQLIAIAKIETLTDGTVTYTVAGKDMERYGRKAIERAATGQRTTAYETIFVCNGDTFGWSARFSSKRTGYTVVHFAFNDYTAPMEKEKVGQGE